MMCRKRTNWTALQLGSSWKIAALMLVGMRFSWIMRNSWSVFCMFVLVDEVMEHQCEDLKLYYDALGYERIKALGYKELNLKNEMMNRRETYHLYKEFRVIFPVGIKMLTDMIKLKMEEVYARYGIRQKGVASHLEKRFGIKIKPAKITLADGSRKGGYEFI